MSIGSFFSKLNPFEIGTNIFSAVAGSHQISKAAKAQQAAIENAGAAYKQGEYQSEGTLRQGQAEAIDALTTERQQVQANNAPYMQAGQQGLLSLTGMLGQAQPQFQFDPTKDVMTDPGFQFRMDEAMKAINRSAASRGVLSSGGTLKALEKYSQGLASQEYGAAYGRAFNLAGARYQAAQQGWENQFGLGSKLAGIGQEATNATNANLQTTYGQEANYNYNTGQTMAQNQLGLGQALGGLQLERGNVQAAGSIAQANNLGGAANSLGYSLGSAWGKRNSQRFTY